VARFITKTRLFDLDHTRTQIGENHGSVRAGEDPTKIENEQIG
jgi:hypothetical protein